MTEMMTRESGRQRFSRFRNMLREHGFRLQCQNQADDDGVPIEIWCAVNTETGERTRFVVVTGENGFDLFFASRSNAFADDIARLVLDTGGNPGEGFESLRPECAA